MSEARQSANGHHTPYSGLTPAVILDALDSVGLRGDGRLLQLNSYENRVFQVYLEDGTAVVAKFYRPGRWSNEQILEEHEFSAELAEQEIPVVAPLSLLSADGASSSATLLGERRTLAQVACESDTLRFAVTPCRPGQSPPLESMADLEWLGRFIGRLHAVGARRPFRTRQTFSVAEFGLAARDRLAQSHVVSAQAALEWRAAADHALAAAQDVFARTDGLQMIRLHGDCHRGNVLWSDRGPHFVDLDDAVNGYAVQDLWMLLSGDPPTSRRQLQALLEGYRLFADFDDRQCALIEPLRAVKMIHHSAWIASRWEDPAFPAAFPWFGESSYWQQQAQDLRDQLRRIEASLTP